MSRINRLRKRSEAVDRRINILDAKHAALREQAAARLAEMQKAAVKSHDRKVAEAACNAARLNDLRDFEAYWSGE